VAAGEIRESAPPDIPMDTFTAAIWECKTTTHRGSFSFQLTFTDDPRPLELLQSYRLPFFFLPLPLEPWADEMDGFLCNLSSAVLISPSGN